MRKINEYIVVADVSVQTLIEQGFQPYGSPVVVGHEDICQAMVKYEEEVTLSNGVSCPISEVQFMGLTGKEAVNKHREVFSKMNEEQLRKFLDGDYSSLPGEK